MLLQLNLECSLVICYISFESWHCLLMYLSKLAYHAFIAIDGFICCESMLVLMQNSCISGANELEAMDTAFTKIGPYR